MAVIMTKMTSRNPKNDTLFFKNRLISNLKWIFLFLPET